MWHKTLRIENVHSRTNGLCHITMPIFYIQCVKMYNAFHCSSSSSSNSVTLKSGFSFLVGFFVYFHLVYFFFLDKYWNSFLMMLIMQRKMILGGHQKRTPVSARSSCNDDSVS